MAPDHGLDGDPAVLRDRVRAVLLGGAVGARRAAACPDDETLPSDAAEIPVSTQLSLSTLDGLLEAVEWANAGQPADETACLWLAYLRWLRHQDIAWPQNAPEPLPRWLDDVWAKRTTGASSATDMHHATTLAPAAVVSRASAQFSTTALALSTGHMGEVDRPVLLPRRSAEMPGMDAGAIRDADVRSNPGAASASDAEAVARSAPFGFLPVGWKAIATMAINGAAITHGHSEAQVASVAFALMVQAMITAGERGAPHPVASGVRATLAVLPELTRPGTQTIQQLTRALERAAAGTSETTRSESSAGSSTESSPEDSAGASPGSCAESSPGGSAGPFNEPSDQPLPRSADRGNGAAGILAVGVRAALDAERQANGLHPGGATLADGADGADRADRADDMIDPASRERAQRQFTRAIALARWEENRFVAVGENRDPADGTAASVAGSLIAAAWGSVAIPVELTRRLPEVAIIEEATDRWARELGWSPSDSA